MAEERSSVKASAPNGQPGAVSMVATDDTQEIREDIERTRDDMARTIDELQERLSPQHIMQQAKDSVHDATVGKVKDAVASVGDMATEAADRAQETASTLAAEVRAHPVASALLGAGVIWLLGGTSVFRRDRTEPYADDQSDPFTNRHTPYGSGTAYAADHQGDTHMGNSHTEGGWTQIFRDHPVPTAVAAASIGYLLMHRDSGSHRQSFPRGYEPPRYGSRTGFPGDRQDAGGPSQHLADSARGTADEARRALGEVGEKAAEWGEQVSDGVRQAGARARDTASDLSDTVQEGWQTARRRTTSEFQEWMEDNPLAVGAAALAVGIALGVSTPRTRFENQTMGATRDALLERTSEMVDDTVDDVKDRVKSAAETLVGDEDASSQDSHDTPGGHGPSGLHPSDSQADKPGMGPGAQRLG